MKRLTKIVLIGLAMVAASSHSALRAQESTLFTMSTHMPQLNYLNPACFPSGDNFYLALPDFNINFISPISMNNIMQYDETRNKTIININHILDTMSLGDYARLNMSVHLLGFGFRTTHMFFTFSSQLRFNAMLGIPYNLFNITRTGNLSYVGEGNELQLLDGNLFNMNIYAEYAVGAAYSFNELPIPGRVVVAVRPKLLVGYANINTVNTNASLYTAEDFSMLRADIAYQLRSSSVLSYHNGDITVNKFFPGNYGFALDLGARYNVNNLEFCFSLLDMGGISWKENVHEIRPQNGNGQFEFTGLDIAGLITEGQIDSTYLPTLKDTLVATIQPVSVDGEKYYQKIPTRFNISGAYRYKKLFKAGLTLHGEIYDKRFYSTTTLSCDIAVADRVELMAGFSVINNGQSTDWFNPGIGACVSLFTALQLYAMMDYTSSVYLFDAKSVNIYAGLNLMLFRGGSVYERKQAKQNQTSELFPVLTSEL